MTIRSFPTFLLLCLLVVPVLADSQPPVLHSLEISPPAVDVTESSAMVAVTARITDDSSGFSWGYIEFRSDSGRSKTVYFSGDYYYEEYWMGGALDSVYQSNITVPQYSKPDEWRVHAVGLYDQWSNYWHLSNSEWYYDENLEEWVEYRALDDYLDSISASKSYTVSNINPDTQAPVLQSLSINPTNIDVTEEGAAVTVTVQITDDLSGFLAGYIVFRTASWNYEYFYFHDYEILNGDTNNGEYQAQIFIPQFSVPEEWLIEYVYLQDAVDNSWYLSNNEWYYDENIDEWREYRALDDYLDSINAPKSYTVTNLNPDLQPPVLQSLSISPVEIDVTDGDVSVIITVQITDDASGFNAGYIEFQSDSGGYAYLPVESSQVVSGDLGDGVYQIDLLVPRYSPPGEWRAHAIYLYDNFGRQWYLSNNSSQYDEDLEEWVQYRALDDYLDSIGASKGFNVVSLNPDLQPPALQSLSINPTALDVTFQDGQVEIRARITDDASGFSWGYISYRSPSGQSVSTFFYENVRMSGDANDGNYEGSLYIPQFSDPGEWNAESLYLYDIFGRSFYLSNEGYYYEEDIDGEWQLVENRPLDSYLDSIGAPKSFNVISITERELGRLDVINNPGEYGLVSLSDLAGAAGDQESLEELLGGDLSQYGLYTAQGIYDLNLGGLMLEKGEGYVTLSLELQTSTNLEEWEEGDILIHEMPVPAGKWFIRVRALGPQ